MEYAVFDRRTMTTFTAILCVALLLGVIRAPMMEFGYWCDNGERPPLDEIANWWKDTAIGIALGPLNIAWEIWNIWQNFNDEEIAQGSWAVITGTIDAILDLAVKLGLNYGWWTVAWYVLQFGAWV